MGFLNFLKKKEEVIVDEKLDVPPAPPPGLEEEIKGPGADISEEEFPKSIKEPEEKKLLPDIEEMPEFPSLPDIEEAPAAASPKQELKEEPVLEKVEEVAETEKGSKPIFLRMSGFKAVLNDINEIRAELKEFEKATYVISEEDENRLYDTWKNNLINVQRKLKFVDKTLFEV